MPPFPTLSVGIGDWTADDEAITQILGRILGSGENAAPKSGENAASLGNATSKCVGNAK